MRGRWRSQFIVGLAIVSASPAAAQLPFFPGAEGYGGTFAGSAPAGGWFANADVYHVTTTADTLVNGKGAVGTLRGAFVDHSNPSSPKQKISNRIVVFDVGGTFQLTQGKLDIKEVNNIYIAGHTAPSPVTVYGDMTQITKSNNTLTSNVVLRYMTFRKGVNGDDDAVSFTGGDGPGDTIATNMILDHVSASWATDENLSVTNNNTNVTVQYSIIADALVSNHAYGSLIRPKVDSFVTFHHNLYANNLSRQARFGTYNAEQLNAEFRNNVIYNWKQRASYAGGSSEPEREFADINYVGNYLIAGPGLQAGFSATQVFGVDKNIDTRIYQSANFVDSDRLLNVNGIPNGSLAQPNQFVISSADGQTLTMMGSPFPMVPATTQSAADAYSQVLQYVGNAWWARDAVDQRIINNVLNNTGPPSGIGAAAPNAAELAGVTGAPTVSRTMSRWDADLDGMPNSWELAHGLNPNSAADNKLDFDADGYINVVDYLNEAGEFPAPAPIVFNGAASTRYAQIMNWKTSDGVTSGSNWQPSKYDTAVVHSGTVAVDAVGQHAGLLSLAPNAGDSATLNVTSGWLDAQTAVEAGLNGAATINHSGGLLLAGEVVLGGASGASGVYNLSGSGVLRTGSLNKGASGGAFNITGGTLSADEVGFDLTNQGGVIAPGDRPGETHVTGDLVLDSGVLEIEIGGTQPAQFDRVIVDGTADLGGMLRVKLVDLGGGPYVPQLNDQFGFLAAFGGAGDEFDFYDLPALSPGLRWQLNPGNVTVFLSVVPAIDANFVEDSAIDGSDFLAWQRGYGLDNQHNNDNGDANADGLVNDADFAGWTSQYGTEVTQGVGGVPEPGALALVCSGAIVAVLRRRLTRTVRC